MRTAPLATRLLLVTAMLSATGCGGGGGGSGVKEPVTITLIAVVSQTGTVFKFGGMNVPGDVDVGDGGNGPAIRGFVSFEIGAIPPGSTVLSATLTLHQYYVGGAPYTKLGDLMLDHVIYGAVLEAGAYTRPPLASDIGVLSNSPTLGARSLDVTTRVQNDLNSSHPQTQYRARFAIENSGDAISDFCDFYSPSSTSPAGGRPTLVVTYR